MVCSPERINGTESHYQRLSLALVQLLTAALVAVAATLLLLLR